MEGSGEPKKRASCLGCRRPAREITPVVLHDDSEELGAQHADHHGDGLVGRRRRDGFVRCDEGYWWCLEFLHQHEEAFANGDVRYQRHGEGESVNGGLSAATRVEWTKAW